MFIQSRDERQQKKKKKKEARYVKNPKGWSRQKLRPKKKKGKSYQVGNLRMQPEKRRILQDENLEV